MYLFDNESWGPCQIDTNTSGKHGFGLPKLFKVSSRNGSFAGTYTLRFKNCVVQDLVAAERSNAQLIRVAIAQFCAWQGNHQCDGEADLDTTLAPYGGVVCNRYGRVLSATSLLPRHRARASSTENCLT